MTLREAVYGLYGAYRLAWLDPTGLSFLNRSSEGALRSFAVFFFVLPAQALMMLMRGAASGPNYHWQLLAGLLSFIVAWLAYLLVSAYLAQRIGHGHRFPDFVTAYNFAGVLQAGLLLPVQAVASAGLLPAGFTFALLIAVFVLTVIYQWFVTKTALDLPGSTAVGFVALDVLLTTFITSLSGMPPAQDG